MLYTLTFSLDGRNQRGTNQPNECLSARFQFGLHDILDSRSNLTTSSGFWSFGNRLNATQKNVWDKQYYVSWYLRSTSQNRNYNKLASTGSYLLLVTVHWSVPLPCPRMFTSRFSTSFPLVPTLDLFMSSNQEYKSSTPTSGQLDNISFFTYLTSFKRRNWESCGQKSLHSSRHHSLDARLDPSFTHKMFNVLEGLK